MQKAICKIGEITGIEFTGHDLRRTTATQMASMGIPRFTIQKILNHVEPGVTKIMIAIATMQRRKHLRHGIDG